ncbi:Guanine nucleotide-binding protein G(I)/G(S)/G(O) subunit gamma-4, partial [Nibea albiflora]
KSETTSDTALTKARKQKNKADHLYFFTFVSIFQVSKAAADLMAYCDAHIREDPLIMPVPASENPFREKKFFCTIL